MSLSTEVDLATEHTWLGSRESSIRFWVHGGELGDTRRVLAGQARFAPGERVLVFLFAAPDGVLWPQAMAEGKWDVRAVHGRTFFERRTEAGALESVPREELERHVARMRSAR